MNSCNRDFCIDDCCMDNCCIEGCCVDERCALAAVLQSVAMQEGALAAILCAESEKIKKAVCLAKCIDELIAINESAAQTIGTVKELENALKEKVCCAIEALQDLRNNDSCK